MAEINNIEEKILEFWKERDIFKKSVEARKGGKSFVFFDGPPTANGRAHMGHLIGRVFKDLWPRYKTMRGYYSERKAGWDTHGLPVEIEIEKKLGLKSKKEIEEYGIAKFNKEAKESVWSHKSEWEKFSERIGFWIDTDNAYITYEPNYVESLWWIIQQFDEKKLLYEGHKILPWCPRCGTGLSSHELAQGYKDVVDTSVIWKFKVVSPVDKQAKHDVKNTYLLAWTTTPWSTLSTMGVSVGPEFRYVKVKVNNEYLILAKERIESVLSESKYEIIEEFDGKKLVGMEYEPLVESYKEIPDVKKNKNVYHVFAGDYVEVTEGTGLVTINGSYGEIDMEAVKKNKLPVIMDLNSDGHFNSYAGKYDGMYLKKAQNELIKDMKEKGLVFKEEPYEHSYPHCWRCKTPLIYYARHSWYVAMSKLRKQLLKNNNKVNWVPDNIKDGRFGEFLREVKDWAFSRERYWGTPLPVWKCLSAQAGDGKDGCNKYKVVGSFAELPEMPRNEKGELDPHRPYIDKIEIKCEHCGKQMKRVPEVVDGWFDSGAMPYAQWHYPFSSGGEDSITKFKEQFPADFISEGIDQTRGWFYTLLAVSTALGKGNPYKNVISYGHVLDDKGKKMSKSVGNVVDPWEALNEFGADATRWYFYTVNSPGESKLFSLRDVGQQLRGFIMTTLNCLRFYELYSKKEGKKKIGKLKPKGHIDKWILSRLHSLLSKVTNDLDNYDPTFSSRAIQSFVVDDLSNWWVRRSRSRFQHPEDEESLIESLDFFRYILSETSKILAPFTPFIADHIYKKVNGEKESVHLEDWSKDKKALIDENLEKEMIVVREVVAQGLAERKRLNIKVRQPLSLLKTKLKVHKELIEYIKDEVNVKEVRFSSSIDSDVELDTEITPDLKKEGYSRDIMRALQDLRKEAGYDLDALISGFWKTQDKEIKDAIDKHYDVIVEDTLLSKFNEDSNLDNIKFDAQIEISLGDSKITLSVKK